MCVRECPIFSRVNEEEEEEDDDCDNATARQRRLVELT